MSLLDRILKSQKQGRPKPHPHYVVTCGVEACQTEFTICGFGGFPCFTICPECHVKIVFWEE